MDAFSNCDPDTDRDTAKPITYSLPITYRFTDCNTTFANPYGDSEAKRIAKSKRIAEAKRDRERFTKSKCNPRQRHLRHRD